MGVPKYQQPDLDPMFAPLMAQSQQQDIEAIQQHLRSDTGSLLARYGSQLAIAGNASGPAASIPAGTLARKAG